MSVEAHVRTETDGPAGSDPLVTFVTAPLGLAGLREFHLTGLDDDGLLFALRACEAEHVRLFAVVPQAYFPGYSPTIDAGTLEVLDLGGTDAVLLVVVHPGADGESPTANLLAPIVLNPSTGAALQVVLESDEWPLRAPFAVAD